MLTGAQEFVEFLFVDLVGQQGISEEKQQKLEEPIGRICRLTVDEDTMAETNRIMANTGNVDISAQQNEAMRNQLQAGKTYSLFMTWLMTYRQKLSAALL